SRTYSTGKYSANDATWIGLSLNGNFSLGGAGRQRVAAAVAEREAARQTLEARRLELRTAWAVAVRQEEGARQRLADIKNVSTLWLTTRDLYWQEYILDKRGLNDELNAEREVYASRVEEMNVTGEAISAAVRALVVEGRLLGLLQAQPALSQEPALGIPVDRTVVTQAAVAPAVTALVADAVSGGGAQVQAPAPAQSAAAEVPTPVRVVAAAPVGRGAWEVQLGIFSRDDQARAAWAALSAQPVLAGRNASFVSSGPFTRLLAGPFDSEAAATAVCTALQATGHEACAVQSLIGEVVREALPVAVMASPEPEAVAIPVAPLRPEVTTFALPPPAEPLAEPAPARQVVVVRGPSTAPQWNIQLGMFSVSDQANATWEALKAEPALRGWTATFVHSGPFTRLLAGPVSSEGEATAACAALQAAGHDACVALVNE
ncbi:MAG: SPOR domain-containing protein, partial [Pseudomonadales bacterium]|nr:SPOR domain-containing protein [Pseudomonadales bacterium]